MSLKWSAGISSGALRNCNAILEVHSQTKQKTFQLYTNPPFKCQNLMHGCSEKTSEQAQGTCHV